MKREIFHPKKRSIMCPYCLYKNLSKMKRELSATYARELENKLSLISASCPKCGKEICNIISYDKHDYDIMNIITVNEFKRGHPHYFENDSTEKQKEKTSCQKLH